MSVQVFLDNINILIGKLRKADASLLCGQASANLLKARQSKRKNVFFLSAYL